MFGLRGNRIIPLAFAAITLFTAAPHAAAGVVVDGTRVVYPAAKREVTINIHNPGEKPSLVQAWLDAGDSHAKPGESKVPFVLTPPLFRLDPTKVQSLRLVYTQDPLPQDRESLFWLNVLDIPPRAAANSEQPNQLELAFKHRMKVFFQAGGAGRLRCRCAGASDLEDAVQGWQAGRNRGEQPHCVSCLAHPESLRRRAAIPSSPKAEMVDPFASRRFDLADPVAAPAGSVPLEYWFVNDYGGNVNGTASASAAPPESE